MRSWLPFWIKTLGTVYLVEAPVLLVMRAIVLMFVPSKSAWTDEFQGFQYRTWSVVFLFAFAAFLSSGVACWVSGVRLARGRPNAARTWRYLAAMLVGMHSLWLVWIFLTGDRFLVFHLVQAILVAGLALYSWLARPQIANDR
jgi:hypothetical protein